MIIAIDGPAGSGKSTIAKQLAQKLKIEYIDSGAIYRTLTLHYMNLFNNECADHTQEISDLVKKDSDEISIEYENHTQIMKLKNKNVSKQIRNPNVTRQVKYIADNPDCREIVNQKIRHLAENYSVIIDGRDIGTKVFPETDYKFYLDALPEIRAKRRALETGVPVSGKEFETLRGDIIQRDKNDMNREIAPLCKASDAHLIDTSELNIEEVVDIVLTKVKHIQSSK
ncbi:(d)CMP kinase [bacterium]|nr:(d)CMP kinase [bacterium]